MYMFILMRNNVVIIHMFKNRRDLLCKNLNSGIIILDSAPECFFNHDCSYPYRQDSYMYYYCGIEESESTLVMENLMDGTNICHLFIRSKSSKEEIWKGYELDIEESKN